MSLVYLGTLERWVSTYVLRPTVLERTGGTIWREGRQCHPRGYIVGISECDPTDLEVIFNWLQQRPTIGIPTFGGWADGDVEYYDLGILVRDRSIADQLAKKYGQIAYWDVENATAITV